MTIIPHTLRHAIRNRDTNEIDVKVLVELHETLTVAEFRAVKPWHIAELLRTDRSWVQRALQHLVELGYLERGDKNGNAFTFRLTIPNRSGATPPPAVAA